MSDIARYLMAGTWLMGWLWGGFYIDHLYTLHDHWWGFPFLTTATVFASLGAPLIAFAKGPKQ